MLSKLSETIARLGQRLDGYQPAGRGVDYVVGMWRIALSAAAEGVDPAANWESDAIPYVPVAPEHLGLILTCQSRMLDLGCLGGYGLFDFARRRRAEGRALPRMVGVDLDPHSVRIGREMADVWAGHDDVTFLQANAEALPFEASSFDLVVARLLLPYVRVRSAMAEMTRVLRPGGLMLVQHHSFPYYWSAVLRHRKNAAVAFHYLRPILSGVWYALAGKQPAHRWFSEIALTPARIAALGRERGLRRIWRGGFPPKPLAAFRKEEAKPS